MDGLSRDELRQAQRLYVWIRGKGGAGVVDALSRAKHLEKEVDRMIGEFQAANG